MTFDVHFHILLPAVFMHKSQIDLKFCALYYFKVLHPIFFLQYILCSVFLDFIRHYRKTWLEKSLHMVLSHPLGGFPPPGHLHISRDGKTPWQAPCPRSGPLPWSLGVPSGSFTAGTNGHTLKPVGDRPPPPSLRKRSTQSNQVMSQQDARNLHLQRRSFCWDHVPQFENDEGCDGMASSLWTWPWWFM